MTRALFQRWLGDPAERKPSEVADEIRKERAMAETMPDWPSLWAREPGLKPPWLRWGTPPPDYFNPPLPVQEFDPCFWIGMGELEDDTFEPLNDDAAACLCRDAAVRWLGGGCLHKTRVGYCWHDTHTHDGLCVEGATADAALYAACEAILDARDAAKAGEPA